MLLVLAASIKVKDYAWYTFKGKRRARFLDHHPRVDLELEEGEVFGLKPYRNGQGYYLVDGDELKTRFKLKPNEAGNLVKRAKTFSGKVNNVSVKDSLRGPVAGHDTHNKLDKSKGTTKVEVEVSSLRNPRENYDLTKKLQSVRYGGMKKIEFIQAREMLPGEVYYYYDAASTLRSYRRVKRLRANEYGKWAKDVEREVERQLRGIDVEVGSVKMKGELRHLLVVVDVPE